MQKNGSGPERQDACSLAEGEAWDRETCGNKDKESRQNPVTHVIMTGATQPWEPVKNLSMDNDDGFRNRFDIYLPDHKFPTKGMLQNHT